MYTSIMASCVEPDFDFQETQEMDPSMNFNERKASFCAELDTHVDALYPAIAPYCETKAAADAAAAAALAASDAAAAAALAASDAAAAAALAVAEVAKKEEAASSCQYF